MQSGKVFYARYPEVLIPCVPEKMRNYRYCSVTHTSRLSRGGGGFWLTLFLPNDPPFPWNRLQRQTCWCFLLQLVSAKSVFSHEVHFAVFTGLSIEMAPVSPEPGIPSSAPPHSTTLGKLFLVFLPDTYLWTSASVTTVFVTMIPSPVGSACCLLFYQPTQLQRWSLKRSLKFSVTEAQYDFCFASNETRVLFPALVCGYLILLYHLIIQQGNFFFAQESKPHCDKSWREGA